MASASEAAATQASQISAVLDAGVEVLGLGEQLTFVQYVQKVLPLDGYIFWIRGDLVNQSVSFVATGSLHRSTDLRQEETRTYSSNNVVFTSEIEVKNLNDVAPTTLFIATVDGVKFAFSSRGKYYKIADLHHYSGTAIQSEMLPQVVDDLSTFDGRDTVVSNSLPLWLALNTYNPVYPTFSNTVMMYPSFLVPANLAPPFASVHVRPESTKGLSALPALNTRYAQNQLCFEIVDITMYGLKNSDAQDFIACINQFTMDYGTIGIMNMPVLRDEKRPQVELGALAQVKTITFEINYLQERVRDVARQLISLAPITYTQS